RTLTSLRNLQPKSKRPLKALKYGRTPVTALSSLIFTTPQIPINGAKNGTRQPKLPCRLKTSSWSTKSPGIPTKESPFMRTSSDTFTQQKVPSMRNPEDHFSLALTSASPPQSFSVNLSAISSAFSKSTSNLMGALTNSPPAYGLTFASTTRLGRTIRKTSLPSSTQPDSL